MVSHVRDKILLRDDLKGFGVHIVLPTDLIAVEKVYFRAQNPVPFFQRLLYKTDQRRWEWTGKGRLRVKI